MPRLICILLLLLTACAPRLTDYQIMQTAEPAFQQAIENALLRHREVIEITSMSFILLPSSVNATIKITETADFTATGGQLVEEIKDIFAARHAEGITSVGVMLRLTKNKGHAQLIGSISLSRSGDRLNTGSSFTTAIYP